MNPVKLITGFLPLALFALVGAWVPVQYAAAVGLAAAVVAIVIGARGGGAGSSVLPVVTAVTLACITLLAFAGDDALRSFLGSYGRGLATLVLAAFILATAPFAPFTAHIAGAAVPPEVRRSVRFRQLNRRISLAWGFAVLATAAAHLVAPAVDSGPSPFGRLLLAWGVPIVAIVAALRYTKQVAAGATEGRTGAGKGQVAISDETGSRK